MINEVRQRVARERLGRRGRRHDPAWVNRRLLVRAGDRLSTRALARLADTLHRDDPSEEIAAAWAVKELLRQLLAARDWHTIAHRLHRFYRLAGLQAGEVTARIAPRFVPLSHGSGITVASQIPRRPCTSAGSPPKAV